MVGLHEFFFIPAVCPELGTILVYSIIEHLKGWNDPIFQIGGEPITPIAGSCFGGVGSFGAKTRRWLDASIRVRPIPATLEPSLGRYEQNR